MAGPTTADGERDPGSGPPGPPGEPGRFAALASRLAGRLPRARTRTLVLSAAALAVLVAGGIWTLYGSPWLRVGKVNVSGTGVLGPDEVREAAGIRLGTPLISVDTDRIADRLASELPRIDEIDVIRSWPRGIRLEVTERKPVLIVEKGGKFIEVDGEAVRFATVARAPAGVPVLELTPRRTPGPQRFATGELTRAAVEVMSAVPARVARQTRTLKVRSYDSITLELAGGRTVDWGSVEKGEAKGVTLTALMKAAPKARHFDVSVPTAPASAAS
ncbi:cell division protein FtsQ/DivIB [Streptomyces sp. NPDC127068]|uniref:cell division protein FtsQ/DivIB n=1 Tax=Streptomyces sp. NPDC127068 TaxID=3347127 RepID=UPI003654F934